MNLSEKIKALDFKGRDYPLIAGTVKFKLHNVHNGKDEVIEEHNMVTNALADMFTNNYGGLINYQNFANLYNTWLGGVLLFQNQLDLTSADDYGIPAYTDNPIKAHAGQTPLTDQADDLTRGNPDNTGTVLSGSSTKLRWEWGTSAGNGTIASLGLTHTDTGSYGAGVASTAQQSLSPFASIASVSRTVSHVDDANDVLAIDGNLAYTFALTGNTTVKVYKTPINNTKFKLQGEAFLPLTAYTEVMTVTLPQSYVNRGGGDCYFHYDLTSTPKTLTLFGVPTSGGSTLYKDVINLSDGTVTHSDITVTGASLWKFNMYVIYSSDQFLTVPTKAIVKDNYLYVFGYTSNNQTADRLYKVNLSDTTDIEEYDPSDYTGFLTRSGQTSYNRIDERFCISGGLIVHDSYIINADRIFPTVQRNVSSAQQTSNRYLLENNISSPVIGNGETVNMISVCKLYLATKFNLPNAVTKTSAQSMTVEYTLSEV